MGTRGLTIVRSRWKNEGDFSTDAVIYRHLDCYPSVHGKDLADFLSGLVLINGIPGNPPAKYTNGPGRLAAQLVSHLQESGHNPSLRTTTGSCGQEYEYYVDCDMGTLAISVSVYEGPMTFFGGGGEDCNNRIFSGSPDEFSVWIEGLED